MMLNDSETEKLEQIKSHIGLKTTTDTIRYLISSVHLKFIQDNAKPAYSPPMPSSPYGTPNPFIGGFGTGGNPNPYGAR